MQLLTLGLSLTRPLPTALALHHMRPPAPPVLLPPLLVFLPFSFPFVRAGASAQDHPGSAGPGLSLLTPVLQEAWSVRDQAGRMQTQWHHTLMPHTWTGPGLSPATSSSYVGHGDPAVPMSRAVSAGTNAAFYALVINTWSRLPWTYESPLKYHGGPGCQSTHFAEEVSALPHAAATLHLPTLKSWKSQVSAGEDSINPDSITTDSNTTDSITADSITTDSITTDSINPDSITTDSNTTDSINPDSITTDSNTTDSINPDSITTDSNTTDSITADSITTDSITTDSINPDSITTDSNTTDSINPDSITTDSNTTDSINPDSITTDSHYH
ncbi:hypothetical protein P7K49_005964 [Saguinus oedipus]|uniref:Uncharacterized protein n=1 Tax=Saguinus oedipus TaxID=9490 RepID=A0ABQ9W121_SAGOE|nr:hypothetical protein P7K49_005964 [Saguinus oedipus]